VSQKPSGKPDKYFKYLLIFTAIFFFLIVSVAIMYQGYVVDHMNNAQKDIFADVLMVAVVLLFASGIACLFSFHRNRRR
jgi:mannose/fructose/N-acetylgalactosamine-specific phosphotransferase system component IIC